MGPGTLSNVNALLNGAHGHPVKGIFGTHQGVISLVLSNAYSGEDGYDADDGDVIRYVEMGAHKVTPLTQNAHDRARENLYLSASYEYGNPIRVLRSYKAGGPWAPSVGLRYDGLYKIVGVRGYVNEKGGKYFQYRLERVAAQTPLNDLATIPSEDQVASYRQIKAGY